MNWLLVIVIHAGMMSHNDDIAISSIRTYQQQSCEAAGRMVADKLGPTYQKVDWVCVHDSEQTK